MQKKKNIPKHWKIGCRYTHTYITFTENGVQISISLIHTYRQILEVWIVISTCHGQNIYTFIHTSWHKIVHHSITCASLRVICTMSPSSVRVIVDSSILSGLGAEESCRPGRIIKITYIIYTIYACVHTHHGLKKNLHGDLQVLGQVVALVVIRFQNTLPSLVILTWLCVFFSKMHERWIIIMWFRV